MADAVRQVPYGEVDLAKARAYVQARADVRSVRSVAGEIGMPHTSLEKFLDGSTPHPRNRILIVEWYLREHMVHPARERLRIPPPGLDNGPGHLAALLAPLDDDARAEAKKSIAAALVDAYRRTGLPEPEWLR